MCKSQCDGRVSCTLTQTASRGVQVHGWDLQRNYNAWSWYTCNALWLSAFTVVDDAVARRRAVKLSRIGKRFIACI